MADDNNQRPYRASDATVRGPTGPAAASDPLAELARLIGQSDPFAEFGRDGARRAPAPHQAAQHQADAASNWPPEPPPAQPAVPQPGAALYGAPDFGRQAFGGAPLAGSGDLYHVESEAPAYDAQAYNSPGYDAPGYPAAPAGEGYDPHAFPPAHELDHSQFGAAQDDYYDDAQPNRRRIGILAIAGIFALAVIGTAGAFGYRALFGSSSSTTPPPVIKADATPSKIVPASAGKDAIASKLINDRVNDRQGEKLVSREEQPVAIGNGAPGNAAFPPTQNVGPPSAEPQIGSGIVGSEPKKIRTIAVRPDEQGNDAAAPKPPESQSKPPMQMAEPAPAAPVPRVTNVTPARQAAPTPAPPAPRAANPPRPAVAAAEPPVRPAAAHAAPAPSNAPLSLNPAAVAAAPARPAPARTAAAAPPSRLAPQATASAASGGYAVQVTARRSEAEAQAAFQSLQGKFPNQLGGRQPLIKRVDLGAKGIYFRAMVGPFGSSGEASELCSSLKAAGGQCLVQRN